MARLVPYLDGETVTIYQGDVMEILPQLTPSSVDLVVTSPPYFAQREYTNGHPAEIGTEQSPTAYLETLWRVTEMLARLLTPNGSLVVNLGDKMNADGPVKRVSQRAGTFVGARRQPRYAGVSLKSLMFLPHRYAIGCIDRLGLCARSAIVWEKGKGNHDAKATGRARRSHEFLFQFTRRLRHGEAVETFGDSGVDVWNIPTRNDFVGHPAVFPMEIPLRCIEAWSPRGGAVLDPFMGAGTTLLAARQLNRRAIGIELNNSFCELATQLLRGE